MPYYSGQHLGRGQQDKVGKQIPQQPGLEEANAVLYRHDVDRML